MVKLQQEGERERTAEQLKLIKLEQEAEKLNILLLQEQLRKAKQVSLPNIVRLETRYTWQTGLPHALSSLELTSASCPSAHRQQYLFTQGQPPQAPVTQHYRYCYDYSGHYSYAGDVTVNPTQAPKVRKFERNPEVMRDFGDWGKMRYRRE
ncbi:hypothetical protein O3P69_005376 [Scylla paramamosain]|uniref:Uncharacterized protein n=1 Tax=Scylla paramamosain TaxID=85552 RepID=A0AAW0UAP0_SCYPA